MLGSALALAAACAPSPQATASPAPTAASTPTATATQVAPGESAFTSWTRIDLPDPVPTDYHSGTPSSVARFNGGFIAVGTVTTCCDGLWFDLARGVIWTSDNGRDWKMFDRIDTFEHVELIDIWSEGGRLFVTGNVAASATDDQQGAPDQQGVPALWVSDDGTTWVRATGPVPSRVVAGGAGLTGAVTTLGFGLGEGTVRFATSPDGLSWADTTVSYDVAFRCLAAAPDGSAIAIGVARGPTRPDGSDIGNAVLWRSVDGSAWSAPEAIMGGAIPMAVAHDARGFV
ncbi:MAG: hypothetical protein ACREBE_23955, partial [bacterium]